MRKSIHTSEYAELCEILRGIRNEAGLSQRALALRLKVTPSWVAKVETGERRIDLIEFGRFVGACGGNVDQAFAQAAALLSVKLVKRRRKGGSL